MTPQRDPETLPHDSRGGGFDARALVRAADALSGGHHDERELAAHASGTVIRPLAAAGEAR